MSDELYHRWKSRVGSGGVVVVAVVVVAEPPAEGLLSAALR
jgi:hypothetical protein